jgi:hypothetical protein
MDVREPRAGSAPATHTARPIKRRETKEVEKDPPGCLFMGLGITAALAFGAYAALVFGYQAFIWLQAGEWVPLPATYLVLPPPVETVPYLADLTRLVPSLAVESPDDWLINPQKWIGFHKLLFGFLRSTSVPGVSLLLAFICFNVGMWIGLQMNEASERQRPIPADNADV